MDRLRYHRVSNQQLLLFSDPGESEYVFDRLPALPVECTRADWSALRLFDHFVATFRENYAFFAQRGVDWERRVKKHRRLVTRNTSPRVLFAIFSDMLDGLEDAHVDLRGWFGGEVLDFKTGRGPTIKRMFAAAAADGKTISAYYPEWLSAYNQGIRDTLLRSRGHEEAGGKIIWGRIDGDVGYINFASLADFTAGGLEENLRFTDAMMERILREFDDVRVIIVDVSNNGGGYDRIARQIAGRFAEQRTFVYSKRPHGAKGVAAERLFVEPSSGRRFTGPVYLVTSDITASGAEILALSMRRLPNVVQIGTATRGSLSDRLYKSLPNGWVFSLSNEIYLDPDGQPFEGRGVPPRLELPVFNPADPKTGHAASILKLIDGIRTSHPLSINR